MKHEYDWNGKNNFIANVNGFRVHMNAKILRDGIKNQEPSQIALAELSDRIGMDVIELLKDIGQEPNKFKIEIDSDMYKDNVDEKRYYNLKLDYILHGLCNESLIIETINFYHNHFCSYNDNLKSTKNVTYRIFLNNTLIYQGINSVKFAHKEVG